jgi:hypothetical protein
MRRGREGERRREDSQQMSRGMYIPIKPPISLLLNSLLPSPPSDPLYLESSQLHPIIPSSPKMERGARNQKRM